MDFVVILVLLIAGALAGIVTGLVSASAVIIMAPLLILVLNMNPYVAIGLSLGTDIVASIVAGRIYYKNKHVNLIPMIFFLFFTFAGITVGSYVSTFISSSDLSGVMGIAALLTGLAFMYKKKREGNKHNGLERFRLKFKKRKELWLSIIGFLVGLNAGIFGAGGGIAILLVLVFLLGYEMHMAIGTSAVIMILMAFVGSVAHFYYEPFNFAYLGIAWIGAFFGAFYSSKFANHISEARLRKISGAVLAVVGLLLTTKIFLW
ncbi:MAG: sulfite exporter TauE/SafE family protein [Nanoarchaeota archaeon]|nr:sulfite exporter TauE/SafE family protein [Nanoarchaeota archaeon]